MAAAPAGGVTERLEASVRGSVQGVGFRWFVQRNALRLRVTGWTANEADGSVSVVAEGPPQSLEELAAFLRRGPEGARVTNVELKRAPATGEFQAFAIRAGAHRGD